MERSALQKYGRLPKAHGASTRAATIIHAAIVVKADKFLLAEIGWPAVSKRESLTVKDAVADACRNQMTSANWRSMRLKQCTPALNVKPATTAEIKRD